MAGRNLACIAISGSQTTKDFPQQFLPSQCSCAHVPGKVGKRKAAAPDDIAKKHRVYEATGRSRSF